jgi:hypothetical protein
LSRAWAIQVLILAFVVIVIGGIGSMRGAFLAALLIGLVDTLGPLICDRYPAAGDAALTGPHGRSGHRIDVDLRVDGTGPLFSAFRSVSGTRSRMNQTLAASGTLGLAAKRSRGWIARGHFPVACIGSVRRWDLVRKATCSAFLPA